MNPLATIGHLARLARAGFVMAREGVFAGVDVVALPRIARLVQRRQSGGLAAAMARLGPSYVKLGQFLATRPDVAGASVADALGALQDKMTPFPREVARGVVERAFGAPVDRLFADFGEPLAAASVAQVHKARLLGDGRAVAVKILRPGVERRFRRDLSDMYFAARIARDHVPASARLRPVEVVDTLARSVRMEMDFRLEAAAASEFADRTKDDPDFRVPAIEWDLTAKDVLTLEWIDGIPLGDQARLAASGHDLKKLAATVIQSFLRHALRDGFFHADMHQGNLFVDAQGRLCAVDFGIMGRLGPKEQRFLAEILYGFITRDYMRVARVHFEAGYVPDIHRVEDFAQAIRAVGEPIHARTADQISMAKVLTLLFEITDLFDMRTRIELVMLQKTMVVVEGVARGLDPQLDMWSTAEPVVRQWIERNLGPLGKLRDAGQNAQTLIGAVAALPDMLQRGRAIAQALDRASVEGFTLSPASIEAIGRAEARRARWGNAALWLIAALLALIAFF